MTWITAHWTTIVAIAGALYSLLSVINGAIKSPTAQTWIGDVLDGLSFITRSGAPGSVKLPFTRSVPRTTPAASAAAKMLFPVLLIGTALLSACGFGTCLLGKLKSQYQTLIEDVTVDLASANYVALLAQLGATVGPDVVTCTVQAVVAYEQSKQAAAPDGGVHAEVVVSPVLSNGKIWLGAHKKVSCVQRVSM